MQADRVPRFEAVPERISGWARPNDAHPTQQQDSELASREGEKQSIFDISIEARFPPVSQLKTHFLPYL